MKVGIVTLHRGVSYGGFLQAYALSQFLDQCGHEVKIVDYFPEHRERYYRMPAFSSHRFGLNGRNFRILKEWRLARRRISTFKSSVETYLPTTRDQYFSASELKSANVEFDVCVMGSDQIWNPRTTGGTLDDTYFGCFGKSEMRRVAYAASFGGIGSSEKKGMSDLPQLLGSLDVITVREELGIEMVRKAVNKEVRRVVDPTFLLPPEDFPNRPISRCPDDYVLGYFLQKMDAKRQIATSLAREFGVPFVDVAEIVARERFSPFNLLALIRGAKWVVTDSFHGTALSIANRKNFTALGLCGEAAVRNGRIVELLTRLDLSTSYHAFPDEVCLDAILEGSINWGKVNDLLQQDVQYSRKVLEEAIAG